LLRQGIDDSDRRARFSGVYTFIGAISVLISFMSIRLFRTIHPVVIGSNPAASTGSFDITSKMLITLFFALFIFSVIFVDLFWHRILLGQLAQEIEQI